MQRNKIYKFRERKKEKKEEEKNISSLPYKYVFLCKIWIFFSLSYISYIIVKSIIMNKWTYIQRRSRYSWLILYSTPKSKYKLACFASIRQRDVAMKSAFLFGSLDKFFRTAAIQNGDIRGQRNYVTRRDSMKSRLHVRMHVHAVAHMKIA